MPSEQLTAKQQRFVEEYLVDLNGKQAAIRTGYHPTRAERTACELLALRKVSDAVAAGRALKREMTGRTVMAVMADIGRVRDDAMQRIQDPDTGVLRMVDHKAALKALELEGKHLGAFAVDNAQKAPQLNQVTVVLVKAGGGAG